MNISTVTKQKYFNGVARDEEIKKYLKLVVDNFEEIGMVGFGQIKFLVTKAPNGGIDYNWKTIDNLVDFATANNLRLHYNTVINNKSSFPDCIETRKFNSKNPSLTPFFEQKKEKTLVFYSKK